MERPLFKAAIEILPVCSRCRLAWLFTSVASHQRKLVCIFIVLAALTNASSGTLQQPASPPVSAPLKLHVRPLMQTYDNIPTDTWSLSLPSDWLEKEQTESGALYFESPEGDKAIYISTWNLGESAPPSSTEVATSFAETERQSLLDMEGYSWETLSDQTQESDGIAVVLVDSLAKDNCYRIASKILAHLPLIVRASFHDYACEDYDLSKNYFSPVIESLCFYDPAA